MEWRQQTSVSCADAFIEAQRWIEEVTGKYFGCDDFRAALENGVLLCDLINQLKPGLIKRVNRLSTPIAGLDNVNVFLKACGKLGLNVSQLFDPGDLQDLSTRATLRQDESKRRLKNVLITIYWLGRKAHLDAFYSGPQLSFKAFEGLLGLALSKALDEGSNVYLKESWYPEREECLRLRPGSKMGNSADSVDSLDTRSLQPNGEGCGSDAEAEQVFKMETTQLPKSKGHIPTPLLWRKQEQGENGRACLSLLASRTIQIQIRPERPVQVNPGWIWSKSLSDIPMVCPVRKGRDGNGIYDGRRDTGVAKVWNKENDHKCAVAAKDSEAQWQDDLTKWKNRRRSTKCDLRRKSQDREHVTNQMVNGALSTFEKKEAGGLLRSDHQSPQGNDPAPHPSSFSPSESLCPDHEPRTRALLTRGYATEVPVSPQGSTAGAIPASDGNILIEETHLASDGATPSLDYPLSSQTQIKAQGSPAPSQLVSELAQQDNVLANQISTLITTIQPNKTAKSASTKNPLASMSSHKEFQLCNDPKALTFRPDAVNQAGVDAVEDHQNHKSLENVKTPSEPAVEQGRGQQAAGVYKYLSRTGSWSRSASLPRGYRRSEGSSRLSSAITARPFGTSQSRVSSLPRLCNVEDNQGLLLESEKEESLCPPFKSLLKRQTAAVHLASADQASIKQKKVYQAKHNGAEQVEEVKDTTLSSQTSFQTNGLNLQTHHNKSLPFHSYPSTDQPKVDHSDMRVSLTLKPNSTPNFGFQTQWDSTGVRVKVIQPGSPAELCQLCVDDEIVAVNGVPVAHMNYSQWKDKITSSLQTGSLTMDMRRYGNKDWSRRQGSHHTQPGQSRVTLNLTSAASILIGCPDHSANTATSTETAVRRVSKFNGPTDNVIQSKVISGELADNHRTAKSKGGSESAISDLQVPSLSPSSSRWSWDHEEDRRRQEKWQEEQERLLQGQYQRDQERLEAEWRRAQQDAIVSFRTESVQNTFEMTNGVESHSSAQLHMTGPTKKTREKQSPDRDELKEAGTKRPTAGGGQNEVTEQTWTKSLSTPALAVTHKQIRGEGKKRHTLSKVELERQQILEEMKKRTQLLTDNSWIRQRSNTVYKEPIYSGVPLKRFESLDNLDTLRQSSFSAATFSYPRPHSAAAGYCVPSRNCSSRYSTGATSSKRSGSMDPSHPGSAWAATNISEELRLESKFESSSVSHTASHAISSYTVKPPVPSPCDQDAVLQITE